MAGAFHASRLLLPLLLTTGCYGPGEGIQPPLNSLYFPVGLAKSPRATRLYAVSSDFDLQFNGGALQAYDLERIRSLVPRECAKDVDCSDGEFCDLEPSEANGNTPSHWCVPADGPQAGQPCGALGEAGPAARWIQPGRCGYVDPVTPQDQGSSLVLASVGVGAFATDVIYRSRPPALDESERPGGRLFVPVRGDATLHWIEADDDSKEVRKEFELDCGQERNQGDCDAFHRAGDNPDQENTRDLRLPPEPYAIDATADGRAIVVTHQTAGQVSLFVNSWDEGDGSSPALKYVLGGMPARVVGIGAIPEPAIVGERTRLAQAGLGGSVDSPPGFYAVFANQAMVKLIRYYSDAGLTDPNSPARPYLTDAGAVPIMTLSGGFDSRGIAFDSSARRACEAACPNDASQSWLDCLSHCAVIPLGVYVTNRTPESLIVGATRFNGTESSSDDYPHFYDGLPLPIGPSRVVVGEVIDLDGQPRTRVFVVCFDQRRIAIYDPQARRIEKWIETGRGPHALALDLDPKQSPPTYALGYVGHFTDSYLGVVDLDRRHRLGYGQMVLSLGQATPPRASK